MSSTLRRSLRALRAKPCSILRPAPLLLTAVLAGCVTENMDTGKMVPRGEQGMQFSDVEKAAEDLKDGMNKGQVMMLMGSPAETEDSGDVWLYLPERYGILIPARFLRLEFKDTLLVDHGYRPIIFGVNW